jgi:hypothetical protein
VTSGVEPSTLCLAVGSGNLLVNAVVLALLGGNLRTSRQLRSLIADQEPGGQGER